MFGIEQLGPRLSGLQTGPSGRTPTTYHRRMTAQARPFVGILTQFLTRWWMACTPPQPMSETSAVLGERRTLRATDLIFPKWQRELLSWLLFPHKAEYDFSERKDVGAFHQPPCFRSRKNTTNFVCSAAINVMRPGSAERQRGCLKPKTPPQPEGYETTV